jgi:hypothetical protein
VRVVLAREVGVRLLEEFIPAVLERALSRVPEEGRTPAGEDATETLRPIDDAPSLEVALVQLGVDLATGLYEIQGGNGGVGQALDIRSDETLSHSKK